MRNRTESATSPCPFMPGAGAVPPYLAGREPEQGPLGIHLDRLRLGIPPPSPLIIVGPRGNGKTVLLEWTRRQARDRGINAISLGSAMIGSEDALRRELAPRSRWNGIVQAVSRRRERPRLDGSQAGAVTKTLAKLVSQRPLALLIDEAQALEPEMGTKLLLAAQSFTSSGSAFLLVLAGTPDLPSNLRKMQAPFWERSEIFPIMRLDRSAASKAIAIPLEAARRALAPEALERVISESDGYPFFLQLWGKALWDQVEDAPKTLAIEDVERARPQVDDTRNRLYLYRYQELKSARLLGSATALAAAYADTDEVAASRVDELLGAALAAEDRPSCPEAIAKVRESLHNLGYIWSPGGSRHDVYVAGIPSLMSFVAEVAAQ